MSRTNNTTTPTIAAIATPVGNGGVGIVRISGSSAKLIAELLFCSNIPRFSGFKSYRLHHGRIRDAANPGEYLDEVLLAWMPGPNSYTGEDVVEINCHGGPAVLRAVLQAVLDAGADLAQPGEFTKRAFLNGRMDLTQAEAVAEVIAAPAREGLHMAQAKLSGRLGREISRLKERLDILRRDLCVALDFPEEDLECLSPEDFALALQEVSAALTRLLENYNRAHLWQDGALVVLAGQVNSGKSSLLNALLGRQRAIVTDIPGTTRDFLEEGLLIDGLPVRLVDTAGLRETGDIVEQEGLKISRDLAGQADLVLLVADSRNPLGAHEKELAAQIGPKRTLCLANKTDLLEQEDESPLLQEFTVLGFEALPISAKHGHGLDALATRIRERATGEDAAPLPDTLVPNLRQSRAIEAALDELKGLSGDLEAMVPYDLLNVRLETAASSLAEITGDTTPDDVLNNIFDNFCVGK